MNFTQTLIWTLLLPYRGILHVTFVKKSYQKDTLLSFCLALSGGSVHLPCHGDVSQDDLWSMLKEMEDVVINLRRRHRTSRIVIGSDLNVSLAPSLEGLTGSRIHSNANGARWREAVTEWMHSLRLRAMGTFDHCLSLPYVEWDHDACCWTHKNSNKGGLFQLDYMLVSEHVHGEPVWCGEATI